MRGGKEAARSENGSFGSRSSFPFCWRRIRFEIENRQQLTHFSSPAALCIRISARKVIKDKRNFHFHVFFAFFHRRASINTERALATPQSRDFFSHSPSQLFRFLISLRKKMKLRCLSSQLLEDSDHARYRDAWPACVLSIRRSRVEGHRHRARKSKHSRDFSANSVARAVLPSEGRKSLLFLNFSRDKTA